MNAKSFRSLLALALLLVGSGAARAQRSEPAPVHTVSQALDFWIKHLAANNYRMAAYILNETPTPDQMSETGPDTVRSKAQVMEYVKGSFAVLHRAVASINEGNMLEPLASTPSFGQKTRLQLAIDVVAHSSNHYGQMVEYLRMNGIVPPASRH